MLQFIKYGKGRWVQWASGGQQPEHWLYNIIYGQPSPAAPTSGETQAGPTTRPTGNQTYLEALLTFIYHQPTHGVGNASLASCGWWTMTLEFGLFLFVLFFCYSDYLTYAVITPPNHFFVVSKTQMDRKSECISAGFDSVSVIYRNLRVSAPERYPLS